MFKRIQFFYCVILMMYFYLFLILALIYFIYFRFTIETFITDTFITENYNYDNYHKYLINTSKLSQKKQLLFLDKINNLMKKSRNEDLDKMQTFDLENSYNELKNSNDKFKKDSCVSISSELCEFTNPYFYLPETTNVPPPYLLKTFKDLTLPKDVDLNCFNTMFNCCKNSKIL